MVWQVWIKFDNRDGTLHEANVVLDLHVLSESSAKCSALCIIYWAVYAREF
jgi:hypothetical protein